MNFKFFVITALLWTHFAPSGIAVTNVFLEAGVAATDREWHGADYISAANIFTAGNVLLPRYSDKQGKVLLERITSVDNFSLCRNKNLALESRMEDFLNLQQGAKTLLKLYVDSANKGESVNKETASLLAFSLFVAGLGIELTDEFIPTIPKDDKYEIRMEGLKKMYSGLTTMFVGVESSLSERNFYSNNDCSMLLEAMAKTLGRIKKAFTEDYRIELRKKLESHKAEFKNKDDAQRIETMLAELRPK